MTTGISSRYVIAGKSTMYFALFMFTLSLCGWLLLDGFCFDPVAIVLLVLGLAVKGGGRGSAMATVPLLLLYTVLYVSLAVAGIPPLKLSLADLTKPEVLAGMNFLLVAVAWATANVVLCVRAIRSGELLSE